MIGLQSLATLITRHRAGMFCDERGSRAAILLGLPLAALACLAYLFAGILPVTPMLKLTFLIIGRLVMGLGESLFLTGLMTLGITRAGAKRTGKVMSWTGIAIYTALGLGAPIGMALQSAHGFAWVGFAALLMPLLAWAIVARVSPIAGARMKVERMVFYRVIALIWRPGVVLTLATVPFATMAAFLSLAYAAHGWPQAGMALFCFGAAYVFVRLVAARLPDRIGAIRVATGSLVFEALGQLLLWSANSPATAVMGATLTGLGFSLIFPSMGVIATRSVPTAQRGQPVGNFMAFADIALGATGPIMGIATQLFGVTAAFLAGAMATCTALILLPSIRGDRST